MHVFLRLMVDLSFVFKNTALTKHMSMVGIDYFGSDVGGFERKFLEQDEDAK